MFQSTALLRTGTSQLGFGKNIRFWTVFRYLAIVSMFSIAIQIFLHDIAAAAPNWLTDEITVERRSDLSTNPDEYGYSNKCINKTVQLPNYWGYYQDTVQCVHQANSFMYTIYEGLIYVNLSGGTVMYPVMGFSFGASGPPSPVPGTDDFVFWTSYFKNVPKSLISSNDAYNPSYSALPGLRYLMSMDETGVDHNVHYVSISENGKWIVLNFAEIGYVRVNTSDMTVKWIGLSRSSNEFITISNDGETMASVTWVFNPLKVYDLRDCGLDANIIQSEWFDIEHPHPCASRDLNNVVSEALEGSGFTVPAPPMFNEDATELTMFIRPNNTGGEGIILKVASPAPEPVSSLDYLALGDSYSSGEGDRGLDSEGWPYYTYASRGVGGCHISTRSYPFLLAQFNNLGSGRVQSVACSGARVSKDYYGDTTTYLGQSGQLKNKTDAEQTTERAAALTGYTPAVLKQIAFVAKNKPKVVTITGGGNDVNFSRIIRSCIASVGVTRGGGDCEESINGTPKRILLGQAIRTQYDEVLKLISAIKASSSSTTIYVIGYPKFLADNAKRCINAAMLSRQEMSGINDSVSYVNDVLAAAAKTAGAQYVSIEDSLHGGRLCEGSQYMTGALAHFDDASAAEMFHPNSVGHIKMAESIRDAGFSIQTDKNPLPVATPAPVVPAKFGASAFIPAHHHALIAAAPLLPGVSYPLLIASGGLLQAHDAVNVTLYSKPVNLGAHTAKADGSLQVNLAIPNKTDPGLHTLVMDVRSTDGSKKRYYQYVEVRSKEKNDRDGDGIADTKDKCLYVEHWYDEQTKTDVCHTSGTKIITKNKHPVHHKNKKHNHGAHKHHDYKIDTNRKLCEMTWLNIKRG